MTKIADIAVLDEKGKPTEAGTRLMEMVKKAMRVVIASPYYRLEKLAISLEVECDDNECIEGIHFDSRAIDPPGMGSHNTPCSTCKGTGKVSILELWKAEVENGSFR